ncbi:hypothetical protein BD408DRAFT_410953 [Parasitella parasitica]|nr:hypothetical protein BD408DRAFT_410950 [Parasitella parasitica]KAI8645994.1 hypothetical protein BD408DRAFT_410953 [Parasitella parasitica]
MKLLIRFVYLPDDYSTYRIFISQELPNYFFSCCRKESEARYSTLLQDLLDIRCIIFNLYLYCIIFLLIRCVLS